MGEISPAPDNLLNRDFSASAPNEKWLTDITEFQIPAGKVYLSPMIDCFDGMVVSWSIGTRPDAELVNTMLDAAIEPVTASGNRPVVHSDRGGHYRWPGWLARMARRGSRALDVTQGMLTRQRRLRGLLRRLKNELFYSSDLAWRRPSKSSAQALGHLHPLVQRGTDQDFAGLLSPMEHCRSLGLAV